MTDKIMNKTIYVLFGLLFVLMLGGWGISADIPVLQAAQEYNEMEQELPAGGVDEIKGYRVSSEAAEQVPSYENQLSFFIRTKSVFEAGTGDYGYHCLSDNEKAFYMSLEISLRNFENSEDAEFTEVEDGKYAAFKVDFAGKNLDSDQAKRVWRVFLADHPGLFWVGTSYWWTSGYLMPGVKEEYGNNLSLIKTIYSKIEDGVSDYLDAVSEVDNTYEKVRIIYDMIIRNVDYAYQSDGTTPESAGWAHSIVGVFDGVHNLAVCEGYAKTFSFLMNILDIPSVYITGATESDGGGYHAWNAVSFDGGDTYCYMDATWDDTGKKDPDRPENLYIYFAMPKSMFEKRHFADGTESKYWRYDLPPMNDNMKNTYFQVYGAYGMAGSVTDDQSAKEFLKRAGALSPEQGWLRLLVDTDTYNKIRSGLGTIWRYKYAQEDDYKMVWAELPEDVCVTIPARELMLSPTNIHIDMNSPGSAPCVQISRVTENSDDYIEIYSTNEKVITVNAPYVKAEQYEGCYLSVRGAGTAAVYAKSAAGGATAVCNVVVEQEASPSPIPTLTPTPSPTPTKAPSPTPTPTKAPTPTPTLKSATPKPTEPVNTATPKPTEPVNTATPKPTEPANSATPKPTEPVNTATPRPTIPGNPATPQPSAGVVPTVKPGEFTEQLNNPTTDDDGVVTWDCVYFGNYWQEDTNGDGTADQNDAKTPIKWRVLSVDGDDVFLVADRNLECRTYNDTDTGVTWETCTMRSWLNGYGINANKDGKDYRNNSFLQNAFSRNEQSAIRVTNVVNDDNAKYGTEGGSDTWDKVYLLSVDEVTNPAYGFSSDYSTPDPGRRAQVTEYANGQGVRMDSIDYAGSGSWWLRSPGRSGSEAAIVYVNGFVASNTNYAGIEFCAARPALHLNMRTLSDAVSDSGWSHAGTVNSEGKEEGPGVTKPDEPGMTASPTPSAGAEPTDQPDVSPTGTPGELTGKLNNPAKNADEMVTWDCVYFGNYWQEDTNGDGTADQNDAKTPIRWRVLSVDGDDAFLLADQNLDCRMYNDTNTDVTWETCTMRSWLNGYGAKANRDGKNYGGDNFLRNAFSEAEQAAIKTTNVVNDDNAEYGTEGGGDTSDKVYLLSIEEAINPAYGFSSDSGKYDESRRVKNTAYAIMQGAFISTSGEYAGNGVWWLRSPGFDRYIASYVFDYGFVYRDGYFVDSYNIAVRPALHLNLKALSDDESRTIWSYAGTVTAEGVAETEEPGETEEPRETDRPSAPTPVPGTPSQPGTSFVMPPAPQPVVPAAPTSDVSSDSRKSAVGKVSALKLRQKKQIVTVSWKKQTGARGYQICYSTSGKWKGKKQKLVTKNSAAVKNLKKNKTYYFRVRAYRLEGKRKVYGAWSGVKRIRIQK